jgi:hypothetical protein
MLPFDRTPRMALPVSVRTAPFPAFIQAGASESAGHFALDTAADQIAQIVRYFMN